ncbi:MAG: general stress protein [Chloroflexi bacterium]|nr:general stress protein [Chloroflexota bacterium]
MAAPSTHVYTTYEEARDGIRALEAGGVAPGTISVLCRSPKAAKMLEHDTGASDTLEDSVDRGHFGFFVDWLGRFESATVPGFGAVLGSGNLLQDIRVAGPGHGAITGALVGSGVPVDEAAQLEKAVDQGQILVVVH